MRISSAAVLVCPFLLGMALAERPPSQEELNAISARGKLLARYDQISWHSTDDMLKALPNHEGVKGYVVRLNGNQWTAAYGELAPNKDSFLIAYEASSNSDVSSAVTPDPGKIIVDTGEMFHEFRAMDTARAALEPLNRPYNDAVLPAPNGQFYVYFYPAQTTNGVIPMGGDWRFLVTADGKTVVEKRQLHASIREDKPNLPKGTTEAAAYHTHVLSDVPEDTDVMYVLMRKPPIPEYVASAKYMYSISAAGDITFMGETKKLLKK